MGGQTGNSVRMASISTADLIWLAGDMSLAKRTIVKLSQDLTSCARHLLTSTYPKQECRDLKGYLRGMLTIRNSHIPFPAPATCNAGNTRTCKCSLHISKPRYAKLPTLWENICNSHKTYVRAIKHMQERACDIYKDNSHPITGTAPSDLYRDSAERKAWGGRAWRVTRQERAVCVCVCVEERRGRSMRHVGALLSQTSGADFRQTASTCPPSLSETLAWVYSRSHQ